MAMAFHANSATRVQDSDFAFAFRVILRRVYTRPGQFELIQRNFLRCVRYITAVSVKWSQAGGCTTVLR